MDPVHMVIVAMLAIVLVALPKDAEGRWFYFAVAAVFTAVAMLTAYVTTP